MAHKKTPVITEVFVKEEDGELTVYAKWSGVDRPVTFGMQVKDDAMAERYADAIMDGVIFRNPRIVKDIYNKTYVEYDMAPVRGRCLNADLRRLGY